MKAIMLSRHDYRETDQLVTFLSAERGKETCLAKGVKKITSKNSAALEPGTIAEVDSIPGSELNRLIRAVPIESGARWRANLPTALGARYFLHMIETSVLPAQTDPALFSLIESWLKALAQQREQVESFLAGGMLQVTSCLGFTPLTKRCIVNDHLFSPYELLFLFVPHQGGFACRAHDAGLPGIMMRAEEKDIFEHLLSDSLSTLGAHPLPEVVRQAVYKYVAEKREIPLERWPRILQEV